MASNFESGVEWAGGINFGSRYISHQAQTELFGSHHVEGLLTAAALGTIAQFRVASRT